MTRQISDAAWAPTTGFVAEWCHGWPWPTTAAGDLPGGVGRHGLGPDSIAKFGWADPVRRAGRSAIRSLLVNILGAPHKAPAKAASPCRWCPLAGPTPRPSLLQNVTVGASAAIARQRSGALLSPVPDVAATRQRPHAGSPGSRQRRPEGSAILHRSSPERPRSIASITSARRSGPAERQAISHPSSVAIIVIAAPAARTAPAAAGSRYLRSRARAEPGTHRRRAKRQ